MADAHSSPMRPPTTPSTATSVVVWGPDRPQVQRAGLAVAYALAARYYWLDVREPGAPVAAGTPEEARSGKGAPPHPIAPEALSPNLAMGNIARWTVVVEPTGSAEGKELAAHVRMPDLVRRLLERHDPSQGPAVLLVTNVDLGADRLYPPEAGTFASGLEVLRRAGISLVVTIGRPPRPNMDDFAHEFRVDPSPPGGEPTVICLRTRPGYGRPFERGRYRALSAFETELRERSTRSTERAT